MCYHRWFIQSTVGLRRLNRNTHHGPIKNSVPVLSRYSAIQWISSALYLGINRVQSKLQMTWLHHIASYMVNANGKRQCWMPFRRLLEIDISLCSCCLHFRNKNAPWGPAMCEKHKNFKTKCLVYRVRLWYNGANRSIFYCSTISCQSLYGTLWTMLHILFSLRINI